MTLIENALRKNAITLKRKAGTSSVGDGVGDMEDLKRATLAMSLFGAKPARLPILAAKESGESESDGKGNMRKFRAAGLLAGKASGLIGIRDILSSREDEPLPGMEDEDGM